VDGGYYDNFGVASALDFLRDAVRQDPANAERPILMLLIEAGPETEYTGREYFDSEGWFYQISAPPKGLIRMWQIAARARNFADLDWVRRHLKNVQTARFVYRDPQESPTSWHLTADQMQRIRNQWTEGGNARSAACVKVFLAGGSCR
jgi:hypothetical protein